MPLEEVSSHREFQGSIGAHRDANVPLDTQDQQIQKNSSKIWKAGVRAANYVKNSVTSGVQGAKSSKTSSSVESFVIKAFFGSDTESVDFKTAYEDTKDTIKGAASRKSKSLKQRASGFARGKFKGLKQMLPEVQTPFSAKVYARGDERVGQGAFSSVFAATLGKRNVVVLTGEGKIGKSIFSDQAKALEKAEETKEVYKGLRKKLGGVAPKVYLATVEKSSVQEGSYTTGLVQERLTPLDTSGMTPKQRNAFCRDFMKGIKRAHDHQIFHGDVKGPNVLMRPTGDRFEPVLIDWDDSFLDIQDMKKQIDAMTKPEEILGFLEELSQKYTGVKGTFDSGRALGSDGFYDGGLTKLARTKLGDENIHSNEFSILKQIDLDIEELGETWEKASDSKKTQALATSVKGHLDTLFNTLQQLDLGAAGRVVYETYFQESFEYEVPMGGAQANRYWPLTNKMVHEKIQAVNADPSLPDIPKDIQEFLERAFPIKTSDNS